MKNNQMEEEHLVFVSQMEDLLRRNMLSQALNMAEERLAIFPLDAEARGFLNQILIEMDRIEESRNNLHALEEDLQKLSFIYLRAADAYGDKALYQDAISCYKKFLCLNPFSEYSLKIDKKIALLQKETGEVEASDADDTEMPGPEFYTITLADLYIKQGHLDMAADVLMEIIKSEPDNVQARARLDTVKATMAERTPAGRVTTSNDKVLKTLSSWLTNVNRLKTHATRN